MNKVAFESLRHVGFVLSAVVLFAMATPSQAARVDLGVFEDFTGGAADPASINTWVAVQNAGDFARLVIRNDSSIVSSVTNVYLDDSLDYVLRPTTAIHSSTSGVDFKQQGNPGLLPSAEMVDFGSTLLSYRAREGSSVNGVKVADDRLIIKLKKRQGVELEDVLNIVMAGGVGVHLRGIGGVEDARMSAVTGFVAPPVGGGGGGDSGPGGNGDGGHVIPVPLAVWPGLVLMGGLILQRRRS